MLAACVALPLGTPAQTPAAPFRPAPRYLSGQKADQEEGRRALEQFRAAGIAGAYWLEFELTVMPRRGAEHTLHGQLYGLRSAAGPLTRLGLGADGRWLIRSGPDAAAWDLAAGQNTVRPLSAADSLQPVAGTDLTVFDLQMPFLYWDDFAYEGLAKIRGRPAHSFVLYPPAELSAQRPDLTGVRVALDAQFQALVQAELLGPKGEPTKTITVLDLKKTGDQWIVKAIDLRNHLTRDKTRFSVIAAALDLTLPAALFEPESLRETPPTVPAASIQRF
ncbi:MAG: outer membrane lipoprotein-sorting protein [Opitutae bacterium]|nr:outer membrane lipoprotein-sorting protein [Opitutae bacterium]